MSPSRVNALVLAGGLGTRLLPLTLATPKCLIEVNGVPLLEYWMAELAASGVGRVVVNTHHLPDPVRAFLAGVPARYPMAAEESFEPELLGSAGTVSNNRSLADDVDDCLLVYADNLSTVSLAAVLEFHRAQDSDLTMVLFHTDRPKACGIADLGPDSVITSFVEKPAEPRGNLANAGIYVASARTYREIADLGAFDFGFDVLPRFVGRMKGFVHEGLHLDIGTLDALERGHELARTHFSGRVFGGGS